MKSADTNIGSNDSNLLLVLSVIVAVILSCIVFIVYDFSILSSNNVPVFLWGPLVICLFFIGVFLEEKFKGKAFRKAT